MRRDGMVVTSALFALLVGCGTDASPASEPEPTPPPEAPAAELAPEAEPAPEADPPEPAADALREVRVVSSDGDWNTLAILDGAYHVTFPGTFEWEVSEQGEYTAYHSAELYQGRMYSIWVHRYRAGSAALNDPALVDDSCAAFGLTHDAVVQPRMDFVVGANRDITGRAGRFTHETGEHTYFNDLVVFRVNDDVVFHAITSRPTYAPIAHFRRMNEGFSVQP